METILKTILKIVQLVRMMSQADDVEAGKEGII